MSIMTSSNVICNVRKVSAVHAGNVKGAGGLRFLPSDRNQNPETFDNVEFQTTHPFTVICYKYNRSVGEFLT